MSKNRKNAYWCADCHGYIVTIDVDEGVTPFMLACRVKGEPPNDCGGMMRSMFYPEEPWPAEDGYGHPIPTEPTWEWYEPSLAWARRQGDGMLDHVKKGGLALRKVGDGPGLPHH